MGEREGRCAPFHRRKAIEPVRAGKAVEEALPQLAFPSDDCAPADRLDVLDCSCAAGEELVREGARLEAVTHRLVGARAHLVRAPALDHLAPTEEEPQVR